jgi:hypothetical protein
MVSGGNGANGGTMKKIRVVALEEGQNLSAQIGRWEAIGWHFRGFLRRAEGIWDRPQAFFEREVNFGR